MRFLCAEYRKSNKNHLLSSVPLTQINRIRMLWRTKNEKLDDAFFFIQRIFDQWLWFLGNQVQEREGGRFSEQSENSKDQDDDQDEREPHEDDAEHEKDSEHEDETERAKQQQDDD